MTLRILLAVASLAVISACATTTPEFCKVESWKEIGMNDALAGLKFGTSEPQSICTTDAPLAYRLGFDYGLAKYCTFEKGLFSGEHGKPPAESCSEPKWDEYQSGYVTGREIFAGNRNLERIASELGQYREQLWQLESGSDRIDQNRAGELQESIRQLVEQRNLESQRLLTLRNDLTR